MERKQGGQCIAQMAELRKMSRCEEPETPTASLRANITFVQFVL